MRATVTVPWGVNEETETFSIEFSGEAKGLVDYDGGCRYTPNGDGWPPSFDVEFTDISLEKIVLVYGPDDRLTLDITDDKKSRDFATKLFDRQCEAWLDRLIETAQTIFDENRYAD